MTERLKPLTSGSGPHIVILILVGLWILWYPPGQSAHEEESITGDSVFYFAYLQSVFEDGDILFADDYQELNPEISPQLLGRLPTGYTGNMFAPGSAILWTPFYLGGKVFAVVSGAPDRAAELAVLISSVRLGSRIYAALALLLIFLVLRRFFDAHVALMGTLAAFFCTPLYYYALFDTINSHAVGACTVAFFFWLCLRTGPERSTRAWMLVGAVAGLVALCRWQNAVVLLWLAVEQIPRLYAAVRERAGAGRMLARYGLSAAFLLVVFSPQLILWTVIYGPLKTPISYGANYVLWTRPEIVNVLFSSRHGLFSWHPMLYLAFVGLLLMLRRHCKAGIGALLVFAAMLYLNSVTGDWWAGDSYGMRRFVSLSAVFALGIAKIASFLWDAFRKWPAIVPAGLLVFFAWWNVDLAGKFLGGEIPHDRSPAMESVTTSLVESWQGRHGYPFAWPGNLLNSMQTDWAPFPNADWIASTYLFYLQGNLGGELLASYPSFQAGFSEPQRGMERVYRILSQTGTVFVSRIERESRTYMAIDADVIAERLQEDQIPVIDVVINGRRITPLVGVQEQTIRWRPTSMRHYHWRYGVNKIELTLWVGDRDQSRNYRREGFSPEGDMTLLPNDGHFFLKVYGIRFLQGRFVEDKTGAFSVAPASRGRGSQGDAPGGGDD